MLQENSRNNVEQKSKWLNLFKNYITSFIPMGNDDWNLVLPFIKIIKISKGEYFNDSKLDVESKIGFIVLGLLRTNFITESGHEYTTDFCTANTITANYDIFDIGNTLNYYTQALEHSIILQMNLKDFLSLCEMSKIWNDFKSKIIEFYYFDKMQREKELISLTAESKYKAFVAKYKHIVNKIPQYSIASYLGISPETLSRIKK
jgi:CRP-like cAMP-binding protein